MSVLTPTRPSSPPGPARALRSTTVRGDERAFAELYERHHQALYRYCRSILRDEHDAQDALQNTMMKAFAALETEQRDFELRPWLFRIAHNEAISVMRRRRQTDELPDHRPDGGPSLWEQVSEREDVRLLREDLALLADQQRAALVLRELSGLGHAEIAQVLDSSPRAVKQTIFEARATLLEFREGRGMACEGIRRTLSDGDGRSLRGRRLRAHVRSCAGCRAFQEGLRERPKTLAALAPPLPLAVGGSLLHQLVGTASGPAAAGVAGGSAAGVAGSAVAGGLATKIAAAVVVAVTAAGGATAVVRQDGGSRPEIGNRSAPAAAPAPAPGSSVARPAAAGSPVRTQPTPGARVRHGQLTGVVPGVPAASSAPATGGGTAVDAGGVPLATSQRSLGARADAGTSGVHGPPGSSLRPQPLRATPGPRGRPAAGGRGGAAATADRGAAGRGGVPAGGRGGAPTDARGGAADGARGGAAGAGAGAAAGAGDAAATQGGEAAARTPAGAVRPPAVAGTGTSAGATGSPIEHGASSASRSGTDVPGVPAARP